MMADLMFLALVRAEVATGFAILLVLALRRPARNLIGAELTYRLWAIVPVAAVVSLFPSLQEFFSAAPDGGALRHGVGVPPHVPHAVALLLVWLAGAVATAGMMAVSEMRFRKLARFGLAGPAVMGVAWPRIVTPADYTLRFTVAERDLIDRHERAHIARRDPDANLFIAALQVIGWFTPLVHIAAVYARLDQELACDAAVIQARPDCRRTYGATLLKAHLTNPRSPLACAWFAPGPHPLEVRLTMLARRPLSVAHYVRGAGAVGAVALVAAAAVWAGG